jgi:hypothetical protein
MSNSDPLYDPTDRDNPNYHCAHGTFTGNPYGADYMCGWCESGEEPPTQAEEDARTLTRAEKLYDELVTSLQRIDMRPFRPELRWALIRAAIDSIDNFGQSNAVQRAWERTHR